MRLYSEILVSKFALKFNSYRYAEDIVSLLLDELLPAAVPGFKGVKAVDSHVVRCPGAVTWFSPGSFESRPPLETAVVGLYKLNPVYP